MSDIKYFSEDQKKFLSYPVLGFILLVLIYRLYCHLMVAQLEDPVLLFPQFDDIYWLLVFLNVPQFITSYKGVAVAFDIIFFALPIAALVFQRTWLYIFLLVWMVIYFITYNIFILHHAHSWIALIFIIVPFAFSNTKHFTYIFYSCRYYLLFIFGSAAIWKLVRGSLFYESQMQNVLKQQHIDYLLFNFESFQYELILYFLNHPEILRLMHFAVVALQLFFIVGFFTRKYDKTLFALLVIFLISNFFVMRINFYELLILGITLLPWQQIFPKFRVS